jgi:heptosyltransferase-3
MTAMTRLALPKAPRILVVTLRRLGDVLLTTPLIRSLRLAYPDASIDTLVFAGTDGILVGNPDIASVITLSARPRLADTLAVTRRIARRYDLAVSTQTGDRPTTLAVLAGRVSVGPVERNNLAGKLKGLALRRSLVSDRTRHRVAEVLRLAELIGIPAVSEIVVPGDGQRPALAAAKRYAVIHAAPMFVYKRWTVSGWRELAAALHDRGLATAVTGAPNDKAYLDEVFGGADVVRLDGRLGWPELSALIRGAELYAGPDTAITHLAAATGTPTVALYGPTDPRLWGPCPKGGLDPIWAASGTIQRRGNVWLVQNPQPCLPCQLEGCERRLDSFSRCLDELAASQVVSAVDQALAPHREQAAR